MSAVRRQFTTTAALLLLFAWCANRAQAQTSGGSLIGTVKDALGAVLPGVAIAVENVDTHARRGAVSDVRGRYHVPHLPPGRYRIEAVAPGFKRLVQHELPLAVQQQRQVDITLEIGELTETVDVVAIAPLVDTMTSSVGTTVDNASIQSLPLDTRNIYSLIYLTPGVAGDIGNAHNRVTYSVNGTRAGLIDTLIDGSSAAFPTVNGTHGISVFPSVDAVREFKVQAGNYPAEFGRSLGGVLNLVTRSGTDAFRGTAYEFYRDSRFDANTFFNQRRGAALPDFSRSQFGSAASGPLARGRAFFMLSYEGLRADTFRERLATVPTALERAGDFSRTRGANGQPIVVYDPGTTAPGPGGSGFVRAPFPGNRIPLERMDPVALNLLRYWPLPNQPGDPATGRDNFYASGTARVDTDNVDVRLDHVLGGTRRLVGRYSYRRSLDAPPQLFPGETGLAEGRVVQSDRGQNAIVDYTDQTRGGTFVNVRLGFAGNHFLFANQSLGFSPTSLGLPAAIEATVDRPMFPGFAVGDVSPLGGGDHRDSGFASYTLAASMSRQRGAHSFKAGYEGRLLRVNVWEARAAGSFTFGRLFTQGPNPLAATSSGGYGFASFLLGAGTAGSLIQNWKNVAAQSFYHASYLQDDWRVSERLTLNLGLRYDVDTPRTERYDRMSWFDPDVRSPLADVIPGLPALRGGLEFVGVDGHPRTQYAGDWDNVAPRAGAAYRLSNSTVIQGAVGRFFGPSSFAAQGTVGATGFRVETPWVTSLDNLTPLTYLRNPFPSGFAAVPGAAAGLTTAIGQRVEGPLRDTNTPNTWQWHLTLQRELPGRILVEAAYVANRGRDLAFGGEDGYTLNQLDPAYLSLGTALNDLVPNPFYGRGGTGLLSQPTVRRAQLLRPYPQFGDVVPLFASGARSRYDALQISVTRRFANGVALDGSYVASKSTDWGQSYQNAYDPASHNALSAVHVPYRLVASGLYSLPVGRGRAIGGNMVPLLDALLGGWQVNGIWRLQAGPTLSVTAANTAGAFGFVTRPNWNGQDPSIEADDDAKLTRWFDTSAFGQPAPFTIGNAPERIPGLRADRLNALDVSILKDVRTGAAVRVQLRVEVFNALNDVQFGAPNTTVGNAAFGQVTSQVNAPRQLQIGLKAYW